MNKHRVPRGLAASREIFRSIVNRAVSKRTSRIMLALTGAGLSLMSGWAASAALLTFNVNMNFDPTGGQSPSGVGTITGDFTVDSSTFKITSIDLTEKTNDANTFGGGFGSPTFTSLAFTDTDLTSASEGQNAYSFGGKPYLFVSTQSPCCILDGIEIGPGFQFDFAFQQGGPVQPGNFDSITSESRYLFGTVTPASGGVPEASTWTMMLAGFGGLGGLARRRRTPRDRLTTSGLRMAFSRL